MDSCKHKVYKNTNNTKYPIGLWLMETPTGSFYYFSNQSIAFQHAYILAKWGPPVDERWSNTG